MPELNDKLTLHGFNNLTKTLSFNIYDISYALTREAQQQYIDYIDETYNAERLRRPRKSTWSRWHPAGHSPGGLCSGCWRR